MDIDVSRKSVALIAAILALLPLARALAQERPPASRTARTSSEKAIVVLAADLRELTSLRDIDAVGDVLFRRIDRSQGRPDDDYDLAIRGSVAADWKAVFGRGDDNRAPHVFAVDPGIYFIDRINIGSGPTTRGPGLDPQSHAPRFGSFTVRPGEVVNLGRLIVHMHWHEGFFAAKVEDNSADARRALSEANPQAVAKLQTRLIGVVPQFPFQAGGGRF
ncbi:hypothetical protein LQG66_20540 [Bradyrhizobium ontarionense]|uniref:Uncharacterized protein n=1 Tax=Bradyrhizobium ontarionense TaxID=2898149 RepID=A0ABY3R354_9BRAD|nr:hypothetical protein [Bradyrhizobium sp. A19]UFZ01711.1 hypothetical protein LQG66_20540 [Bradyrhizobium sp. A19]